MYVQACTALSAYAYSTLVNVHFPNALFAITFLSVFIYCRNRLRDPMPTTLHTVPRTAQILISFPCVSLHNHHTEINSKIKVTYLTDTPTTSRTTNIYTMKSISREK